VKRVDIRVLEIRPIFFVRRRWRTRFSVEDILATEHDVIPLDGADVF
jgi:hypothetical protein